MRLDYNGQHFDEYIDIDYLGKSGLTADGYLFMTPISITDYGDLVFITGGTSLWSTLFLLFTWSLSQRHLYQCGTC